MQTMIFNLILLIVALPILKQYEITEYNNFIYGGIVLMVIGIIGSLKSKKKE